MSARFPISTAIWEICMSDANNSIILSHRNYLVYAINAKKTSHEWNTGENGFPYGWVRICS
jgi:hypothetical protein